MSDLRIMENALFDSTVQVSASSEDPSFPVSNLTKFQRSDVWRSYGNFVITSSNNKIDFKHTGGGSEKTISVPSGRYTPTALATKISDLLTDAAGTTDTITCSYSYNTGLFTITTSGTYLDVLFSTGTNAASSLRTILGFGSIDRTGATTYNGLNVTIHTEEWVLIDLGAFTGHPINSAVLFFEYGTGHNLSETATVKLQANQTNEWSSPAVDVSLSHDTTYETYSYFFSSDQEYRYWRVQIVDVDNANLYVELPKLVLSKSVAITQVPSSGFKHTMSDISRNEVTAYGHMYSDSYSMVRALEFTYNAFSKDDLELLWQLFRRCGKTTPLAVALDTQGTLYDKDRFCLYAYISSDYSSDHRFYSYFDTAVAFREAH